MTIRYLILSLASSLFGTFLYAQNLNYYFGNLHAHSAYSDGNKDASTSGCNNPSCSYSFAKASQHFDFLGISDHNHASAGMTLSNYHNGYSQAISSNQEGVFLCLYGMEWGVSSSNNGHVIIYGFGNQLIGWEAGNYDIFNGKTDYDGLFKKVKNNPNAFCYLAHPHTTDFGKLLAKEYNPTYDSAIVGVPFRNGPAFSQNTSYSDYSSSDYSYYYKSMLAKGYKLGIGYDHDNHYTTFGRVNGGRLVILAPSLTTTNLFSAMKNMHFYGSDDWNAKIDFKINGTEIMGNIVTASITPTITVIHNDDDGEIADSIKIWTGYSGNNTYPSIIKVIKNSNVLTFVDNSLVLNYQKYYFIEIVQQDGQRIITSPIWYTKDPYASVNYINYASTSIIIFPNPFNENLSISSTQIPYQIKIYDPTGRIIMQDYSNESNKDIDTKNWHQGIYFIEISSHEKIISHQKIIKN